MAISDRDKHGIKIFGAIAAATLFLVGWVVYIQYTRPQLDDELCPLGKTTSSTVVLFDKTDPLSATQKTFVWKRLMQIGSQLALYEKLSLYSLSDDTNTWSAEPLFAVCNPGNTPNPLIEPEWKVHKKFKDRFGSPLEEALKRQFDTEESKQSPIMEMIETLSLKPSLQDMEPHRRMVIVSDLMQNSSAYSHYKKPLRYDDFESSPFHATLHPNLRSMDIEVIYLERESLKNYQNGDHIDFWQKWFYSYGGSLKRMDRVR